VRALIICLAAAALLLGCAAARAATPLWTVGYRTPTALRGLQVVRVVPALRVAVVRGSVRCSPGIRFIQRTQARTSTAEPAVASVGPYALPLEWQYTFTVDALDAQGRVAGSLPAYRLALPPS
jgi:hypothetical protein